MRSLYAFYLAKSHTTTPKKPKGSTPSKAKSALERTKEASRVPGGSGTVSPATSRASSQPPSEFSPTPPLSPSISGAFDFGDMSASLELPPPAAAEEPIEMSFTQAKLLEEVRKARSASGAKNSASMIVIGMSL